MNVGDPLPKDIALRGSLQPAPPLNGNAGRPASVIEPRRQAEGSKRPPGSTSKQRHGQTRSSAPGRPSKRTDDARERLLKAIRRGNTFRDACLCAGISEDTFANWRRSNSDFSDAVKRAEAEAVMRNVAIVQEAAKKTWQAAAWWLERRYPSDWALWHRVEHSGRVEGQAGEASVVIYIPDNNRGDLPPGITPRPLPEAIVEAEARRVPPPLTVELPPSGR